MPSQPANSLPDGAAPRRAPLRARRLVAALTHALARRQDLGPSPVRDAAISTLLAQLAAVIPPAEASAGAPALAA